MNGDIYMGHWRDGKPDGTGSLIHIDGTIYNGQFKNGLKNGHGVLNVPGKPCQKGIWANDYFSG
jgi:hypothetical protein